MLKHEKMSCLVTVSNVDMLLNLALTDCFEKFNLNLHFLGTRTKMRGLDETGACANYVETEQVRKNSGRDTSKW